MEAHSVERKLAAIFAADVDGYSRLMGLDEVGTLRTLTAHRVIIDRLIALHRVGSGYWSSSAALVDAGRERQRLRLARDQQGREME